jgi:hypothetical protein
MDFDSNDLKLPWSRRPSRWIMIAIALGSAAADSDNVDRGTLVVDAPRGTVVAIIGGSRDIGLDAAPNTVADKTHHSATDKPHHSNGANGSDVISVEFLRPLEYRDTVLLPHFEGATKVSIEVRVAMAAEPENCSYRVVLRGIFATNVSLTVF